MTPTPRAQLTTVTDVLDNAVRAGPEREAVADEATRLTYVELAERVDRLAAGLARRGVAPGDRVAASLPNGADIIVAFLATMRIGAVWVGIHPALAAAEKEWIVRDAGVRLLLGTPQVLDPLSPLIVGAVEVEAVTRPGGLDRLEDTGAAPPADVRPETVAAIAYTSGTTGRPKGVVHDHRHALLPGNVILHDRMGGRGERVGVHLPLTTFNLMILGPLLAFQGLGSCVCTDRRSADLPAWIAAEAIEHLSTAPATVFDLVHDPDVEAGALTGVRLGVGGAACPEGLRVAYRERFGRSFTTGYGLTEAPSAVVQETEQHPHVPGASGRPMAHVEVVVCDDRGTPLPPEHEGEICIGPASAGPWAGLWSGMVGYWQRPDETAASRHGVLLRTGDLGWLDTDGHLFVADRRGDLIVRGGSNVYPAEVVRVLLDHPAVADAAVFARPHERLGHEVVAVVALRAGHRADPASLRRHCSSSLARFKVPSHIAFVDELPRNSMGKVSQDELRALVPGPG